MIEVCKELGIIPIAHTPLDRGFASGKYNAMDPSGGKFGNPRYKFVVLDRWTPLHEALGKVAERATLRLQVDTTSRMSKSFRDRQKQMQDQQQKKRETEITKCQVAINYIVTKGAVPIPGIKNKQDAEELLGCVGWMLTDEEMEIVENGVERSEAKKQKNSVFFKIRRLKKVDYNVDPY